MTNQKLKLGFPLTVATVVYILCSLFGSLFYLVLPPFLCSIGARIHAYTLILYAIGGEATVPAVIWMIISHIFVLGILILGVIAIIKGNVRIYSLLVALEIIITFIFLTLQESGDFASTHGIVVNIGYCIWLFRHAVRPQPLVRKKIISKKGT